MDNAQQLIDKKALYEVPNNQVFMKNFLAGFSRGLGHAVAQIFFFAMLFALFAVFVKPQIQPILNLMERSVNSMESVQQMQQEILDEPNSGNPEQVDLSEILQQLNTGNGTTTR